MVIVIAIQITIQHKLYKVYFVLAIFVDIIQYLLDEYGQVQAQIAYIL